MINLLRNMEERDQNLQMTTLEIEMNKTYVELSYAGFTLELLTASRKNYVGQKTTPGNRYI